jgi:hypothetical protein
MTPKDTQQRCRRTHQSQWPHAPEIWGGLGGGIARYNHPMDDPDVSAREWARRLVQFVQALWR